MDDVVVTCHSKQHMVYNPPPPRPLDVRTLPIFRQYRGEPMTFRDQATAEMQAANTPVNSYLLRPCGDGLGNDILLSRHGVCTRRDPITRFVALCSDNHFVITYYLLENDRPTQKNTKILIVPTGFKLEDPWSSYPRPKPVSAFVLFCFVLFCFFFCFFGCLSFGSFSLLLLHQVGYEDVYPTFGHILARFFPPMAPLQTLSHNMDNASDVMRAFLNMPPAPRP